MRRGWLGFAVTGFLLAGGCTSRAPDGPVGEATQGLEQRLGDRLQGKRVHRVVGALAEAQVLLLAPEGTLPETDEAPVFDLALFDPKTNALHTRALGVRTAVVAGKDLVVVDRAGVLLRLTGDQRVRLLEGVHGEPALLPAGDLVISRLGDEPGESDLWLVPAQGEPRALAPAVGADDLPVALPSGAVAFISARTTVASLWRVDPSKPEAVQLTNIGLVAGGPREGFVPTPAERLEVVGGRLEWDAGGGERWAFDEGLGRAVRLGGGQR